MRYLNRQTQMTFPKQSPSSYHVTLCRRDTLTTYFSPIDTLTTCQLTETNMTFLLIMNDIGLRVGLSEPLHASPTSEYN